MQFHQLNVYVPKDRVTNLHQGYGFVEFRSEEDADYAIKVLNMVKLDGKPIRVNKVPMDHTNSKIGTDAPPSSTPNWTINVSIYFQSRSLLLVDFMSVKNAANFCFCTTENAEEIF
ncbi:hypothetical protein ACSBR2_034011 [Camellia fascicularis]